MRTTTPHALLLLALTLLAGCGDDTAPAAEPTARPTLEVTRPAADAPPLEQALALAPLEADTLTVTDWDAVRAALGEPDVTGGDPLTDRIALREQVAADAVVLTDGVLAEHASALELDHGIAPEDVDWEAHWAGEATGWAVRFRDGLDAAAIRDAVRDPASPLHGADVRDHLVVLGAGDPVWASDPVLAGLVPTGGDGAVPEATYLHQGCVPLRDALGPDATADDQEAVLARHRLDRMQDLEAFAVTAGAGQLMAWLGEDRADLMDRTDLIQGWPNPSTEDALTGYPVEDAITGRIGMRVRDPRAAAQVVLTDELPWTVCRDVQPFEEPTGL